MTTYLFRKKVLQKKSNKSNSIKLAKSFSFRKKEKIVVNTLPNSLFTGVGSVSHSRSRNHRSQSLARESASLSPLPRTPAHLTRTPNLLSLTPGPMLSHRHHRPTTPIVHAHSRALEQSSGVRLRGGDYACCFYLLSIFKSTPTSNEKSMGRK
jgi:hypothetical protein